MQAEIERERQKIVEIATTIIPFEGWTEHALKLSMKKADIDPNLISIYFPNKLISVYEKLLEIIDYKHTSSLDFEYLKSLKVREKIFYLIKTRLEISKKYKETLKTGSSLLSLPSNTLRGSKKLWLSVDKIWKLAGDNSLDFNYYSKRIILSAVYASTLLYWFEDYSEAQKDTIIFLQNRIDDALKFGKFSNNIVNLPLKFTKLPFIRLIFNR
ncbi:MAG: COQ9 family protein [Sphingobacteriia bacterium]|nr:COQ9 family protein [Sphingobacteriia bacterium]